jgi:hypothetical protein
MEHSLSAYSMTELLDALASSKEYSNTALTGLIVKEIDRRHTLNKEKTSWKHTSNQSTTTAKPENKLL